MYKSIISECRFCPQSFNHKEDRSNHEIECHISTEKPYKCRSCPKKFYFREDCEFHEKLHSHVETVHSRTQNYVNNLDQLDNKSQQHFFNCKLCTSRYSNKKRLKLHIKWRHTDKNPAANNALRTQVPKLPRTSKDSEATTNSNLQSGSVTDRPSTIIKTVKIRAKTFFCSICDRGLASNTLRRDHERIHNGDLRFECQVCGKKFPSMARLNPHLKRTLCSMKKVGRQRKQPAIKTQQSNLKKSFPCQICGKCLSTKSTLNRHSEVHTGIKPFQCQECPNKYVRKETLQWHIILNHSEERTN